MGNHKISKIIFVISALALTLFSALVATARPEGSQSNAHAIDYAEVSSGVETVLNQPVVIGQPCGSGELMSPDTICLHGRVLLSTDNGQTLTPLDGVQVNVSYSDETLSAATFVHAGDAQPTYGIDIEPLEPYFLDSVTISVVYQNQEYQQQAVVFPDFDTHNQQVDIIISDVTAFDDTVLWGYVVDYESLGPVAGAVVTAEFGTPVQVVTTVTTEDDSVDFPIYTLNSAQLPGVTSGDTVTLTADFQGREIVQAVTIDGGNETQQQNLIVGWQCSDQDPFGRGKFQNRSFGRGKFQNRSFPGFPDTICVWGYGLSNGDPATAVEIEIEIDGNFYQSETKLFPGESTPRYGIALPDGEDLLNKPMTITAVYNGLFSTESLILQPQDSPIQRYDLNVIGVGIVGDTVSGNGYIDHTWLNNDLWVATTGGLVHWANTDLQSYIRFTPQNSDLVGFDLKHVKNDGQGNLYLTSRSRIIQKYMPATGDWLELDPTNNLSQASFDITSANQIWYQNSGSGYYRYSPDLQQWEAFLYSEYPDLSGDLFTTYEVAPNGDTWFVTFNSGLIRYRPSTQQWDVFNTSNSGIPQNWITDVAIESNQSVWLGTKEMGVVYFDLAADTWEIFNGENSQLNAFQDEIYSVSVDTTGLVYVTTIFGVQTYNPSTDTWSDFDVSSSNFPEFTRLEAFTGPDDSVWFGSDFGVIGQTDNISFDSYVIFDDGPVHSTINNLVEDVAGRVWFATEAGLSMYDPTIAQWKTFSPLNSTIPSFEVLSVEISPNGVVYAGLPEGMWVYNLSTQETTIFSSYGPDLLSVIVYDIYYDEECLCLIIGSDGGINRYFPLENRWESYPFTPETSGGLFRFMKASNGDIWVATAGSNHGGNGVRILDAQTNEWRTFTQTDGLINDTAGHIAQTSDGRIWISQYFGGITEIAPDGTITNHTLTNSDLPSDAIESMSTDQYDRILIGTASGMYIYEPYSGSWSDIPFDTDLGTYSSFVWDFSFGRSNDLWLGTENGAIHWNLPVEHSNLVVNLTGPDLADVSELESLSYTVTITNEGQLATLMDTTLNFPASSSLLSSNFGISVSKGTPFNLGILLAGETKSYQFSLMPTNFAAGDQHIVSISVDGGERESITSNNSASVLTRFVSPDTTDLSTAISGPPSIVPGQVEDLLIYVANEGGKTSSNTSVSLDLPAELTIIASEPQPLDNNQNWAIPSLDSAESFSIRLQVQAADPVNLESLSVTVSTDGQADETNVENNQSAITIPVLTNDIRTLFLVAPERLADQYGPSGMLNTLYQVAEHPQVQGLVVNLEADTTVAASLEAWASNPTDWSQANRTAESIRDLLNRYLAQFDTVDYVVLVGGDTIIPHYRIDDLNETQWQERNYAVQVQGHEAAFSSLLDNKLLIDDYYVDREPTVPDSYFWTTSDLMYLPDYAIGRLVETPVEIISVLQAFIDNDGVFEINDALVGGDDFLAGDLVDSQCAMMNDFGLTVDCAQSDEAFSASFLAGQPSSVWTSYHSNHYSMGIFGGAFSATDLFLLANADASFMGTIGCHAGLNVADAGLFSDIDIAQGVAHHGGLTIGSTAYTYGSSQGVNYTEALMEDLTQRLLSADQQPIGPLLSQSKHAYYLSRGWFNYLDAKSISPMMLYGLPMTRYDLPDNSLRALSVKSQSMLTAEQNMVSMAFSSQDYARIQTADGEYFTFMGQSIAQHKQPIQPVHREQIPFEKDGKQLKGMLILQAEFEDIENFDPVVNESWVMGAQTQTEIVEPALEISQWDRDLPVSLSLPTDGTSQASLNYVPGLYNAETEVERLFSSITLQPIYGGGTDNVPPIILAAAVEQTADETTFSLNIPENQNPELVLVVYEDGDTWRSDILIYNPIESRWEGAVRTQVDRYRLQVVDSFGNVADVGWLTGSFDSLEPPISGTGSTLYLPFVNR